MTAIESAPCPTCRRPTRWRDNPHRPFCSERCKLRDLGAWAGEEYRVAGEPLETTDDPPGDDSEGDG